MRATPLPNISQVRVGESKPGFFAIASPPDPNNQGVVELLVKPVPDTASQLIADAKAGANCLHCLQIACRRLCRHHCLLRQACEHTAVLLPPANASHAAALASQDGCHGHRTDCVRCRAVAPMALILPVVLY